MVEPAEPCRRVDLRYLVNSIENALYAGNSIIICGRVQDNASNISATVSAVTGSATRMTPTSARLFGRQSGSISSLTRMRHTRTWSEFVRNSRAHLKQGRGGRGAGVEIEVRDALDIAGLHFMITTFPRAREADPSAMDCVPRCHMTTTMLS